MQINGYFITEKISSGEVDDMIESNIEKYDFAKDVNKEWNR